MTMNGNVQLNQAGGVRIAGGTINGNVQANDTSGSGDPMSSGSNVICDTTVQGNVQIHGSDGSSAWHAGSCGTGNTISNTTVAGNLQCEIGNTIPDGKKQCAGL
jgi:hypothetical protein